MCLHKGNREKIRCPQYVKASANSLLPSLFFFSEILGTRWLHSLPSIYAITKLICGHAPGSQPVKLNTIPTGVSRAFLIWPRRRQSPGMHIHTQMCSRREKNWAISGKANVTVSAAWGGGERERACRVKGVLPGVNMFPGLCTLLHINYPGKPWAFCLGPLNFNTPLSYTATAQP